jgi:hypothetical protein
MNRLHSTGDADMGTQPGLTVQCTIVGHASPRWKGAAADSARVQNNETLSKNRAQAVTAELKSALAKELGGYRLDFRDGQSYADDMQPDQSATIDWEARGQRESLVLAGGDRTNDDPTYRRTDLTVRIARSTQDAVPTKVRSKYERSTKSKFWYASVGVSASVEAVAGFEFFRVKLRNWRGDEATGSVAAVAGGVGLKYSYSPYSWTEEASFSTPEEIGFERFHGVHVRYTTTGLVIGAGYTLAWLTFYGLGRDAASLQVGGWSTGAQLSMDFSEGILLLDTVPGDLTIDYYDDVTWNQVRSDWITEQKFSLYFADNQWALTADQITKIGQFATRVANDIRTN